MHSEDLPSQPIDEADYNETPEPYEDIVYEDPPSGDDYVPDYEQYAYDDEEPAYETDYPAEDYENEYENQDENNYSDFETEDM